MFHERRALHDGYRFGSRLYQWRGAPSSITPSIRVSSPEGPPAGAEVGHRCCDDSARNPSVGRPASITSVAHARAAALRQRCVRSRASAGRSGALARCFCASLPEAAPELLLAQIVCASSRCFAPQEFGTNVSPGSAVAVKSLRTRLFGRSQYGHNDRE